MKLATYFVVAMGVLSSASNAQEATGLDAIYTSPDYSWDYYTDPWVNDINSSEIDDVRLFTVGDQYWMTIYADKEDANSAYTGVFKSNVSDGIDGLFATARNSGLRWGINGMLEHLQDSLGHEYFTYTPVVDGEAPDTWSWNLNWGGKAADWLEDYQGTGWIIDDHYDWNSRSNQTALTGATVGATLDLQKSRIYGNVTLIDPDGGNRIISYNQTVYEDGQSYGFVSEKEVKDMVNQISQELTSEAFSAGWDAGFDSGYNEGYENGYNKGYKDAISDLRE